MLSRYRTIADVPQRIPIFPLAGCIVLPRATLPLNIFEPRYLQMIDDVLKGDRVIGIIQPTGDGGVTGSPLSRTAALARVGCTARLTNFQELEDGRLLIVLTGVVRFNFASEVDSQTPYRVCDVDYGPFERDLVPGDGEEAMDRERLLATLKKFLNARRANADWKSIEETSSEQLVNWLSLASPFGPKEKQALLEARDLAERAKTLIALTEMDIAGPSGSTDAGGNPRLQ